MHIDTVDLRSSSIPRVTRYTVEQIYLHLRATTLKIIGAASLSVLYSLIGHLEFALIDTQRQLLLTHVV